MNEQKRCPICAEGHIERRVEEMENEYKGHRGMLPLYFVVCDHCKSDFATSVEGRLSRRALLAWRKQIDGLLVGREIAAIRKRYGLTQTQASRLFGVEGVAFSKYENDDLVQSETMDVLLRRVLSDAQAFEALVLEKGMRSELADRAEKAARSSDEGRLPGREAPDPTILYDPKEFRLTEQDRALKRKKP
jgi:HTH-type transcriptional regulator / antitoxin MqsA